MARQDRDRAIDLFEQHDAHELVGHVAAPKASLKLAFWRKPAAVPSWPPSWRS